MMLYRILILFIFLMLFPTVFVAQDASNRITLENIESLLPIQAMGRGQPLQLALSPDESMLAVGTTTGVWLYKLDALDQIPQQFWMDIPATVITFSPSGGLVGVGAADGTGRVFDLITKRQLLYVIGGPVPERGAMANYNIPATGIGFTTTQGTGHKTTGMGSISGTPVTDSDGTLLYLDVILGGGVPVNDHVTRVDGVSARIVGHEIHISDGQTERVLGGFTQRIAYATMDIETIARWVREDFVLPSDTSVLMTVGVGGQGLVWDIDRGDIMLEQSVSVIPPDMVSAQAQDLYAHADRFEDGILVENQITGEGFALIDPTDATYVRKFTALAFRPDGKLLAAGRYDTNLTVWDMTTRAIITTQYAHFGAVMALDWSPDGTILYSGGEDNRVFAWELTNAADYPLVQRAFLGGHAAPVIGVWALADGARVVSVSKDGTALVWGILD
jgi:WD40 repeat protein